MSSNYWITTIDNNCNPFTHFLEWFARDRELGYDTCQWIDGAFVKTSNELDEKEHDYDVDCGTSDFLAFNPYGMHYKVYEDEADTLIPLMYQTYVNEIKPTLVVANES